MPNKTVYFKVETLEALELLSQRWGLSRSATVAEALRRALEGGQR